MRYLEVSAHRRRWTRGYPPLILLAIAILAAVLILPSSLNLPQSNPSTVLEYAPVPPQDQNPQIQGNLSSLGLGSSRTLTQAAPVKPPPPPRVTAGVGGNPKQFQCVGNPPRQTEDPASPPCVPFFQGDNFGATYQGVSSQQITVLAYYDVGSYGLTGQLETTPADGTYVDIDKPRLPNCPPDNGAVSSTDPTQCDQLLVRVLKSFSHFFNSRFQTYNRHIHFWAYFTGAQTAAQRRSDAVGNWQHLKPFAVIDGATFNGYNQEYDSAMNQLGVISFSSTEGSRENSYYRKNAPLSWGFFPDVEHWAKLYSTYVCTKVAPYPVRKYGNPSGVGPPNGGKRKFGFWSTSDPTAPGLQRFADLVETELQSCGVTPLSKRTFSKNGYAADSSDTGTEAAQAAADFQSKGVTTVLYLGGTEGRFSGSTDAIKYYPEIVVAGSLDNDNNFIGQTQDQNTWQNAWAMTFHIRIASLQESPGYRAYKEGDPSGDDSAGTWARDEYRDVFNLFQGIQVAGPRLTPQSIDKGFHAIPPHSSSDPFSPALFFDPGDYTSLKDGAEEWWDPSGQSPPGGTPSRRPGCWRMVQKGQRWLAGHWPSGDDAFRNTSDPCTGYGGAIRLRT